MSKTREPNKLDPKVIETICKFVRHGNFVETAAACAGVTSRSVRGWLARGAADLDAGKTSTTYAKFHAAFEKAQGESTAILVRHIEVAAAKDWRASAWLLEKKLQKLYGHLAKQTDETAKTLPELIDELAPAPEDILPAR